jgi:Tfp pilus assembly protein PilO
VNDYTRCSLPTLQCEEHLTIVAVVVVVIIIVIMICILKLVFSFNRELSDLNFHKPENNTLKI